MADRIVQGLEKAREKLLDITFRNRALNFRLRKTQGVEIIEGDASMILTWLLGNKALSFVATVEDTGEEGGAQRRSAMQRERTLLEPYSLATPYTMRELDKRLRGSYQKARLFRQEQGVNALYMVLGMLHYYESPTSEDVRKAPLLLIPVEIKRSNIQTGFSIRIDDGDDVLETNLSLQQKLQRDVAMQLPSPNAAVADAFDITAYFEQIEQLIRHQPRWSLDRTAVLLDTFTFSRLVMYEDLNIVHWQEVQAIDCHPIIQALLGDGFQDRALRYDETTFMDAVQPPEDLPLVVEADSSQLQALLEADNSKHLIVQGPPGTGKSQTITNLMAMALNNNKKVLFVAEKMAALQVVKRNLDNVGLGVACLELHSHNSHKKALLEELQRSLARAEEPLPSTRRSVATLRQHREHLNSYLEALHSPIGKSAETPYSLYGKLLHLQHTCAGLDSLAPIDLEAISAISDCDEETWLRQRSVVADLQGWCAQYGAPHEHPLWGSQQTAALPQSIRQLQELCSQALSTTRSMVGTAEMLAAQLNVDVPTCPPTLQQLSNALEFFKAPPQLELGHLHNADIWLTQGASLQQLAEAHAAGQRSLENYQDLLLRSAWQKDSDELERLRRDLVRYGRSFWRLFSRRFHRAKRAVADLCRTDIKKLEDMLAVLDAILSAQQAEELTARYAPLALQAWGEHWQTHPADTLCSDTAWALAVHQALAKADVPAQLLHSPALRQPTACDAALLEQLHQQRHAHAQALQAVIAHLEMDEAQRFGEGHSLQACNFEAQCRLLQCWHDYAPTLQAIIQLNSIYQQLQEAKLAKLLPLACTWPAAAQHLLDAVDKARYDSLLESAFRQRPALATFNGAQHDTVIGKFQAADLRCYEQQRLRLQAQHQKMLTKASSDPAFIILQQQMKRKRPIAIRELMKKCGQVVQQVKPIFMMSPLSVAKFLPPGCLEFDIVVFDEASQIRPEEALGAIARAKQVVVVGDDKQLPPTTFFDVGSADDDEEEDAYSSSLDNMESILESFDAQGAAKKMLRWHYRSQHESLIAVSNAEFYTPPGLLIFPSASKKNVGIKFHHHPETLYHKGVNEQEADIVARAVIEHFRCHPEESLGVAALNQSQMNAIEEAIETLRYQNKRLEPLFQDDRPEPFFVKNLETIQGDERDVIFISIGFGRGRDGKISMNFGPINKLGGERRLNVLTTRAKKRCEIFSNLSSADIRLTGVRGVEVLQRYLHYAEKGALAMASQADDATPWLFEQELARQLRARGHDVRTQVGVAGYFVDLAIVQPQQPERYLLGIVCDGESYRNARSTRDRDRLRQTILEQRGWRIHRVWSTDWFLNPQGQLETLLQGIEEAQAAMR